MSRACGEGPPDLPGMLSEADSALIIGDPALRPDPATLRRARQVTLRQRMSVYSTPPATKFNA